MTQTRNFEWRQEYAVGVASIDTQHRILLDLLNEVRSVDTVPHAEPATQRGYLRLLEKLNDYAAYHFLGEEALMHEHLPDDPDSAAHIAAHRAYWGCIAAFRERYLAGDEPAWSELLRYLERWWLQHIQETDRALAGRLNRVGVQ